MALTLSSSPGLEPEETAMPALPVPGTPSSSRESSKRGHTGAAASTRLDPRIHTDTQHNQRALSNPPLCPSPEFGISWVVLLDWEKDKEGLCFIKNLSNKWRTPEIKNITASITMKKRTPGLILLPEEDDGVTVGEIDSFWEK
nr:hypothetical protein Iba_chr15aCG15930 [Ipomoea batatas]